MYLQGRAVVLCDDDVEAGGAGSHAGRGAATRGGRRLTHARAALRRYALRRYGGRIFTDALGGLQYCIYCNFKSCFKSI